jgi:uncharacterized protein
MKKLEPIIIDFFKEHHVLTLATSDKSSSWCCNCFYVYLDESIEFLFTSDENTLHIQLIRQNPIVSGSIVLETKTIGKIRGVQFQGAVNKVEKADYLKYKLKYLKAFPYAILKNTSLWKISIDKIKMTDNRLGFGKKLHWNRTDI